MNSFFPLDVIRAFLYILQTFALVAQSVEHRIGSAEVSGPIPLGSFSLLHKI